MPSRLFEHEAFPELLNAAAEYFAPRFHSSVGPNRFAAHAIEKDYYLTEVLRVVQREVGDPAIFKGGTSLTKGWGIADRFSEDVDLFIDPLGFAPPLGGKAMRTRMRGLVAACMRDLPLVREAVPAYAKRGLARTEYLRYESTLVAPAPFQPEVCLALGIGSGREPVARVALRSSLAEYLSRAGIEIGSPDTEPFEMRLLHFRRTFVEKLFAIDHAVTSMRATGFPIGPLARHYFDLHALAARPEVHAMLRGSEYREILRDCIEIDRRFYRRPARDAGSWSFRTSPALFPGVELGSALGAEYESQCRILCFGAFPSWREVLARFEEVRRWL